MNSKSRRPSVADLRAEEQRKQRQGAAQRKAMLAQQLSPVPGVWLIFCNLGVTVTLFLLAVPAVLSDSTSVRATYAVFSLICGAAGCGAFGIALVAGAKRSRHSEMTMAGWWFLAGTATRQIWCGLVGAVILQSVIAVVAASLVPFSSLAFGVLVPLLGLGICGSWGALFGVFPEIGATV